VEESVDLCRPQLAEEARRDDLVGVDVRLIERHGDRLERGESVHVRSP